MVKKILWKHTCRITFFPSTIINALITEEQGQDFLLSSNSYLLYSRYSTFSTPSVYIFPVSQRIFKVNAQVANKMIHIYNKGTYDSIAIRCVNKDLCPPC